MRFSTIVLLFTLTLLSGTASHANSERSDTCSLLLSDAWEVDLQFSTSRQRVKTAKASTKALLDIWIKTSSADPQNHPRYIPPRDKFLTNANPMIRLFSILRKELSDLHTLFDLYFPNNPGAYDFYCEVKREMVGLDVKPENLAQVFLHRESVDFYAMCMSPMQRYFSSLIVGYGLMRLDFFDRKKLKILDLGAGIGDTTYVLQEVFPKSDVIALDASPAMLATLTRRFPKVETLQADFNQGIPLKPSSLDLVVSVTSAGLYPDLNQFKKLLAEVKKVLKPGGHFLLEYGHPHSRSQNELSSIEEFLKVLEEAGFHVENSIALTIKVFGMSLYPILIQKPHEGPR